MLAVAAFRDIMAESLSDITKSLYDLTRVDI